MIVDLELIDHLYKVDKSCTDEVGWDTNVDTPYEHYQLQNEVLTEDNMLLRWYGWFTLKYGERKWGFKLEYQKRYEVRSWDMEPGHYCSKDDKFFGGVGQHKHFYRSEQNPRATYSIPKGEISITDPNKSVVDFCAECNIRMINGYQHRIFPRLCLIYVHDEVAEMACAEIKEKLLQQLGDHWYCKRGDTRKDSYILTTTSLLPNNDCIRLMIEPHESGGYRVHDMSSSYIFLNSCGINLADSSQTTRLDRARQMAERYNVEYRDYLLARHVEGDELWKGVALLTEAIRDVCGMVNSKRAVPDREFKEEVYGLFKTEGANVEIDYLIPGFTKRNRFDVRLNGGGEILCKTVSTSDTSKVQSGIERAWFAFDDVRRAGRSFQPAIVYDDSEESQEKAWKEHHFAILKKREIWGYGFNANRNQLLDLAQEHSR